ncbi:glycosyltransferase [Gelria sp. Kuro-4]|uniref:glycosyltransferase n=1 Tax=Gelria sp. Kuro-4 TaxID=2796927 RepID=UPI001BEF4B5F|nr:glycosyltransferase [Gelria sp. Kuro-4]BCV25493.1 glycosyl transferase [Gelria sp. Kuro-4]
MAEACWGRPLLSLCMIAKNEEENLSRCLRSVQGAVDEIILVDTGSEDQTKEIAAAYGAKVLDFAWNGDFAAARNRSLEKASGEWILFLDADEELDPESRAEIRSFLQTATAEGYYLEIISYVGDKPGLDATNHVFPRLFRNRPEYRFKGALHEQISCAISAQGGRIELSPFKVYHYGYLDRAVSKKDKIRRNIAILLQEVKEKPADHFTRYNLGVEYIRLGEHDQALVQFKKAFVGLPSLDVGYASVLVKNIVVCLKELKRYKEALQVLNDALLAYPDYTDLTYLKATVLAARGEYSAAIRAYEECLEQGKSSWRHISLRGTGGFRARYGLAQVAERIGDEATAVQNYTRALDENPLFLTPVYDLARILLPREEVEAVKAFFSRHTNLEDPEVLLALAGAFAAAKKYAEALEYAEQALQKEGFSPQGAFVKGEILLNLKRYREAIAAFDSIRPTASLYEPAQLDAMFCLSLLGEEKAAQERLARVKGEGLAAQKAVFEAFLSLLFGAGTELKAEPGETEGRIALDLLGKLLDLQEFDAFAKALPLSGFVAAPQKGLLLGKLYFEHGFKESAAEGLLAAAQAGQADAEAFRMLGDIAAEAGQDAGPFYSEAIRLEPQNRKYYLALGGFLTKEGRFGEAEAVLLAGVRHFPKDEVIRTTLRLVRALGGHGNEGNQTGEPIARLGLH